MATISDVAAQAGVSIKTVSRVLNKAPHVRDELRQRVERAAQQLNYRPNQAARRLAGSKSFLIAHLYDNPNPQYIAGIQAGAARRCRELGYHLVVEPVDAHSRHLDDAAERMVATLAPDGILLSPPLSDNAQLLATLDRLGTPVARLAAARHDRNIHIFMDERAAARAVTEHLIALGHKRIGIVRGHPEHAAASARLSGYQDALSAAGLRPEAGLVAQGYFDIHSGMEATRVLLAANPRPTAIFATNDEMALGGIMAARAMGVDVPGELSIAGFDDTPMSRLIWPALTTVRQPLEEMGWTAVESLLAGPADFAEHKLPFELMIRASTVAVG
ncbi:LacI family DNA-binding transcriptional regulator [Sphingomonas sp. ID0503]|uniref:LacI family DNA-binding transcriptional regulator n=1 Tax=Sphingomonas sp. ID0503 TaxID=3399691 RepID=UPI003AFAAEFE